VEGRRLWHFCLLCCCRCTGPEVGNEYGITTWFHSPTGLPLINEYYYSPITAAAYHYLYLLQQGCSTWILLSPPLLFPNRQRKPPLRRRSMMRLPTPCPPFSCRLSVVVTTQCGFSVDTTTMGTSFYNHLPNVSFSRPDDDTEIGRVVVGSGG